MLDASLPTQHLSGGSRRTAPIGASTSSAAAEAAPAPASQPGAEAPGNPAVVRAAAAPAAAGAASAAAAATGAAARPGADARGDALGRMPRAGSDDDSDLEADVAAVHAQADIVRRRAARRSSGAAACCSDVAASGARAATPPPATSCRQAAAAAGSDAPGDCTGGASRGGAREADLAPAEAVTGAPPVNGIPADEGGVHAALDHDSGLVGTWGRWTWGPAEETSGAGPAPEPRAAGAAVAAGSAGPDPRAGTLPPQAPEGATCAAATTNAGGASAAAAGKSLPGSGSGLGLAGGAPAAAADALNSTLMSALIHGQGAPAAAGAAAASSELALANDPSPGYPNPNPPHPVSAPSVASNATWEAAAAPDSEGAAAEPGEAHSVQRVNPKPRKARPKPSAKAVCAVWELLEACIASPGATAAESPGRFLPHLALPCRAMVMWLSRVWSCTEVCHTMFAIVCLVKHCSASCWPRCTNTTLQQVQIA